MKKLILAITLIFTCLCLSSCSENNNDAINIDNKSMYVFDNISIKIKDGYYYDRHEKFTVDDNTIGVTIYFSNIETWDDNSVEE